MSGELIWRAKLARGREARVWDNGDGWVSLTIVDRDDVVISEREIQKDADYRAYVESMSFRVQEVL